MLACTKIGIYEWFQQIRGWNRMDFLCGLVSLCNPFELRFIGSCIEDFAQNDYNCLRDQEIKANTVEHLTQFMEKNVHSSEFRSHIILCLAMLHSTNYKAGTKLAIILDDQLKQIDSENLMVVGMEAVVDECMLMLTLASHHPALSFEKKLSFKTKLMDYEKILHRKQMQNSRYGRCYRNPHASAKYNSTQEYCAWVPHTPVAHQFMSFPVCQNMIPHPVYANSLPYSSGTGNTLVSDDSSGYCTIQSKVPCDFEPNDKKNRNVVRVTVPTSNLEVSFHNYVNKPIYVHSSGTSQQPSTVISRDQSIVEHSSNSTTTVTTTRSDINTCTCSQLQPSSVKMLSKNKAESANAETSHGSKKMPSCGTRTNRFMSYPGASYTTDVDLTSTSAVPLSSEKGVSHHSVPYQFSNNVPEKISAKVAVTDQGYQRNCKYMLHLKVTWKNGEETECSKTEEDVRKFHDLVTGKVRNLAYQFNTEIPTKHTSENQEVFDLYFSDVLALPNSLLTCDNFLSFFQPSNVMPSQSLPLKKRKLKPDMRNRTRESTDNNGSSSSSSVSPLPAGPKINTKLLHTANCTHSMSFPAISSVASVSLSRSASTSPTLSTERNQELEDDESDTRNDEYLKLYYWLQGNNLQDLYTHIKKFTYNQFVSSEDCEVDAIQGLSNEQKTVLKQLLAKLNSRENSSDDAALEIDMGKLVISTENLNLLPEAKSKENSDPDSESEDDKRNSLQYESVEFETTDSLHAVASNSCFSFEFDSSSATPSEKNSDIDTGSRRSLMDDNAPDTSNFSTALVDAANVGWEWGESSQFSASALPYVHQQSSNQKLSYYVSPQSQGQILVIPNLPQKFQCYQPCHPTPLAIHAPMSNGTAISSPSQLCSPTFIAPSQSQFPIVSSPIPKPVLLTYIPTSSYCSGIDCSTIPTTGANFPTYTMTSTVTNPISSGGYYQAMDGTAHARDNSIVPQHPSMASQNIFVPEDPAMHTAISYVSGYSKPGTLPVIPIYPGKNVPIQSINSSDQVERDTDSGKMSFASNDSEISSRIPGSGVDGQYFMPNGHNPQSPVNYFLRISPMYNASPSQTNLQNEYVRGYHNVGSNSVPPLYYTPNGYQETLYSMHSTQSMSGPPLAGGRDHHPSRKHQVYCPGCGESGHWALDCGKESAVEGMENNDDNHPDC